MQAQIGLNSYFQKYLEKESLFLNKEVLQIKYVPETILHRQKQIDHLAEILAPALKVEKPSNIFLYGKCGTGKTVVTKFLFNELTKTAKENKEHTKTISDLEKQLKESTWAENAGKGFEELP